MKDTQKPSGLFSRKTLFIISVVLFITSIAFLSMFIRERQETKKLTALILEKQQSIYAPTPKVPETPKEQKTTVEYPAKQQAQVEKTEAIPDKPVAVPISFDSNTIPSSLVYGDKGEYALLCEKDSKMLYLFRFEDGIYNLVKGYPCLTGANHRDKQKPGDEATPVGVFFFLRFIPGKNLPKQYGFGAFVMNYPNFLARKEGRQGNGIWLHGHDPEKNIGKDITNTKGCIVVDNKDLEEISRMIKPRGTPIIVVSKIQISDKAKQSSLTKEINHFLSSWKHDWESLNTKKYLSHYSTDFSSGEGLNYASFKQQKERVNRHKKFIKIAIEEPAFFIPPEYAGKIAVVRFRQKYNSDNFKSESAKIFYLRKEHQKWQIIGESLF